MDLIEQTDSIYEESSSFYLNLAHNLPIDKELYNNHPYIFIICLKNDANNSEKNCKAIEYYLETHSKNLEKYTDFFTMVQFPVKILYKNNIRKGLIKIKSKDLDSFNKNNYPLKEEEYVYLMLNVKEYIIRNFLDNYTIHLDKFVEAKIFTSYFNIGTMDNYLISLINNIDYNKYWQHPKNINIDTLFNDRLFNLPLTVDTEKLISNNFNNYGDKSNITFNQAYFFLQVDELKFAVSTKKSHKYKVNTKNLADISKEVEFFLTQDILSEKERYYLLCNLLVNKLYCHLVVTNALILEKNKDIFAKYQPIFRYLLSYVWIILSDEEKESAIFVNMEDRFVFTLEAANNLPHFPFCLDNMKNHPYTYLNVSDKLINRNRNAMGIKPIEDDKYTIVNLETFRRRLNIFVTGKANDNVIEKLDFNNCVITGSVMPAILPTLNPLMYLCNSNKNTFESEFILNQYFDKFYKDADIDIACNYDNFIDFIDFVDNTRNIIATHYNIPISEIVLEPVKNTILFVDSNVLKSKCQLNEIPFDYDFILDNKGDMAVRLFFYELYLEEKKKVNIDLRKKIGTKGSKPIYLEIFNYCNVDKIKLFISDNLKKTDENIHDAQYFYTVHNSNIFIRYCENLKFKLKNDHLLHSLEMFNTKLSPLSLIAKFHFSCVKAFYNGKTCYLLPSSISAYNLFINFGLHYFAGNHNPIDLINKYRYRGFSILLNEKEYDSYIKYNKNNAKYKDYIDRMHGPLELTNGIYNTYVNKSYVNSENYNKYWKDNFSIIDKTFVEYNAIDMEGNVNPMKYWLIDAIYDLLK